MKCIYRPVMPKIDGLCLATRLLLKCKASSRHLYNYAILLLILATLIISDLASSIS